MRKELYFGFTLMAIILIAVAFIMPWSNMSNGHIGLLMLALVVVAIMLGFPTAFTLMGMGMLFAFYAYASRSDGHPAVALQQTLDLMVQKAFGVMTNDVLISIPLFVFMGYLIERANLIEKLFKSLHLSLARVPGSLAVATLVTCAIFATATGIVGAVVTLMGLLAMPAMLRAGYSVQLSAGAITAGGCLGILIPPSVMLIVYGATAGVSVVKLYAGAFFPGLMLAALYVGYVIVVAKLKPHLAPPLSEADRKVELPTMNKVLNAEKGPRALTALFGAFGGSGNVNVQRKTIFKELGVTLLPAIVFATVMGLAWNSLTTPNVVQDISGLEQMGSTDSSSTDSATSSGGLQEPPVEGGLQEPPASGGLAEPPGAEAAKAGAAKVEATKMEAAKVEAAKVAAAKKVVADKAAAKSAADVPRDPTPMWFWYVFGVGVALLALFYVIFTFTRLEVFKMLLTSFFPLAVIILAVLGTIVLGLATPTEAAAVGSFGGFALAGVYLLLRQSKPDVIRRLKLWVPLWLVFGIAIIWFLLFQTEFLKSGPPVWVGWMSVSALGLWSLFAVYQAKLGPTIRESSYLTAKTSAMVCWLFVGSSIFSAAFALLGGQEIIETWVLSLGLTPMQFMLLSQFIIFILGWPLEWTEIIVIFMPIFIPLLPKFGIDPLFFGLLVALNLQTAFLSPPVAMAAFYLKGVAPKHVTLNQIFAGMMPFMAIQVLALVLLYVFPQIGLWLPSLKFG
jgi:TRAP-type mannitol/chloroaromatic compound transport system permease large subunit